VYALVTEFNVQDDSPLPAKASEFLQQRAVPRAKDKGAVAGYWLNAQSGYTLSVVLFDSEEAARAAAHDFKVGDEVEVPGLTWRSEEIREVLAHL
jgi:hypothetical protein